MSMKQSLFDNSDIAFAVDNTITWKKKKWKIISRSKVVDKDNRANVLDYFIVARCKSQVLTFLESNMADFHIENWYTFHNKFFNSWLNKD